MNGDKINIYRLIDPVSQQTRYVGATKKPLPRRLSSGLSERNHSKDFRQWIKDLREVGEKPIIEFVEAVDYENAWVREQYWIEFYRAKFPLFNVAYITRYNPAGKKFDVEKKVMTGVDLPESDNALLKRMARDDGITIREWIRRAIRREAKEKSLI
jgi:hypothetical protein